MISTIHWPKNATDRDSLITHDFSQGHDHDHGDHHHHEPGMPFDFNYAVKDDYYGTDYSHNAVSDGDVVRGEYKVIPTIPTRIV